MSAEQTASQTKEYIIKLLWNRLKGRGSWINWRTVEMRSYPNRVNVIVTFKDNQTLLLRVDGYYNKTRKQRGSYRLGNYYDYEEWRENHQVWETYQYTIPLDKVSVLLEGDTVSIVSIGVKKKSGNRARVKSSSGK